jgi:hypothetical protein
MRQWTHVVGILLMLATVACRSVEVEKVLAVTEVRTGWYDLGVIEGKNKLVPSISLKLRDESDQPISSVQINAIFHRVGEPEAWGEHFVKAIGTTALAPGASTPPIVLRSYLGYTGEQSRSGMLQHTSFVDATVDIFAKHGSRTWVKLGEYTIARELLTQ